MGNRKYIGEFEELVLLVVANLGAGAYGLRIRDHIISTCNRKVNISAVHSALHRLEKKGYLHSAYDSSDVSIRGGRPKLIFKMTGEGMETLRETRKRREALWKNIPATLLKI